GTVRDLLGDDVTVDVVPPGFDTQAVGSRASDTPPQRAGVAGSLRALMVAHWTPRKGILTALRALAQAPVGVSLDLVGDATRAPAYARRVVAALRHPALSDRVRVHGVVPTERLTRLYAESDAFLLTSAHEGYGMALAEALRAGLPIVATRVGAVPELLGDDAGAELVAAGDVGAIARALGRLADDPEARAERAARASARGRTLPTWRQSAVQFDRILRVAIDRRAATDRRSAGAEGYAGVAGRTGVRS
ncbi:MAG: glycosyltransferase, partial [Chloroflexota bacterium]|nr:glycosyltransferase [Chloroflexota bacterium]